MKLVKIIILVLPILIYQNIYSQQEFYFDKRITKKEKEQHVITDGKEIKKLPKYIPVYENKSYLYADFKKIKKSQLTIYLINNSRDTLLLSERVMERIQQEYNNAENKWLRSQSFFYGWCGTQYIGHYILIPGKYIVIHKTVLNKGIPKKIRYSFYSSPFSSSNEGNGFINQEDIKKIKYDDISYEFYDKYELMNIVNELSVSDNIYKANFWNVNHALLELNARYPEDAYKFMLPMAKDKKHTLHEFVMKLRKFNLN